jgi:hypothetical protein
MVSKHVIELLSKHFTMENIMAKATKKNPAPATTTEAVAPAADAQTNTTLEPVQLTVSDLQLLAKIIDLASRRGAFQAGELSQVGDAFNKLASFLAYVESVQKKEKEEAENTEAPAA